MTINTTRRRVLAGMAGAAAALPAMTAVGTQAPDTLQAGVQVFIADIRALPGSTPYDVYLVLQGVADRLERLAAGGAS